MEFEIGQEWQLVNGHTITIIFIDDKFKDGEIHSLGSDSIWRDYDGYCVCKDFDEGFNFSHIVTDVAKDPMETSDFSFRLHDDQIKEILKSCKSNNGFFDALEFGQKVSLATTRKLKELTND